MALSKKKSNETAPELIRSAHIAYQTGNTLQALALTLDAVKANPKNLSYVTQLCQILKYTRFQKFHPNLKSMMLTCLNTNGLDYQDLSDAWYSILFCDPYMKPIQDLVHDREVSHGQLRTCLKDLFVILGLEKLMIYDMGFEKAVARISKMIESEVIKNTPLKNAIEAYSQRIEHVYAPELDRSKACNVRTDIPVLSSPQNDTSASVQEQYEENPYPRWDYIYQHTSNKKTDAKPYKHLIAGCGTGYGACSTALQNPEADITAIDITMASLSYAKTKAEEYGIQNIRFYQADILDLDPLEESFDVIECSGVLHHMADPIQGWKNLKEKLAPNGRINIGLYSKLARQDVNAARDFIQNHDLPATSEGIKTAREKILQLPEDHPAKPVLKRRDFYSLSSCRDLLFHVQEHQFTVPELQHALEELNLTFDGFTIHDPKILKEYQSRFPNDPKRLNLDNWHDFEQKHPDTFRGMYQFWCHPA